MSRYRKVLIGVSVGIAGVAVGFGLGMLLKKSGHLVPMGGWHLAAIPLLAFLAIGWHEFGHLAGGWLSGFRTIIYAVGPLRIDRVGERLKLRFNDVPGLWGGVAGTAPLDGQILDSASMRRALLILVAGGPLFSWLGALLLVPAYLFFGTSPFWWTMGGMGALFSLGIGIVTLIPMSGTGFRSDGSRILQLLRGGESAERWANLGLLSGFSYVYRPREWPAAIIERCGNPSATGFDAVSAAWLRALYHLDRNEAGEARFWIDRGIEIADDWPKAAVPLLKAAAARVYAAQGDPAGARRWLENFDKAGFHLKSHVLHAEAAVLAAEGRPAEARERALEALKLIPPGARGTDAAAREELEALAAVSN